MELRFGLRDIDGGKVVQGEDLISLDKLAEYQESM